MNLADLRQPFAIKDIEVRAGQTNGDKTKAMALAYVTSRAIMDRLDEVCGPENWADMYTAAPVGGVLCGISIRVGDDWVTKWDGADNTNFEAVKGGLSGSFKRAGVKWGIGRYLYDVPSVWVSCQVRGKTVVIDENEAKAKMFGKQATQAPTTSAQKTQTVSAPAQTAPAKNSNGNAPTSPAALLALLKSKGCEFNAPAHLLTAIKQEQADFVWPKPEDTDGWRNAYKLAKQHSDKKAASAPVETPADEFGSLFGDAPAPNGYSVND